MPGPMKALDLLRPAIRPHKGPLVESYFLKANAPDRREAVWIKFTFLVPARARARASVWAIHFDAASGRRRAFKESWALESVTWRPDPFHLSFGDCSLDGSASRGRLRDDLGSIAWDLTLADPGPPLVLLSRPLLHGPIPRFKLVSPKPDSTFSGRFTIDGEERSLERWRGMLGHNWGPAHSPTYAWAHCNVFDDSDSMFEAGCSSLRLAGMSTPLLTTLALRHDGRRYELRKALSISRRRSDLSYYRWFFSVSEPPVSIEGVVQCARDEMVGLYYDNPDGSMLYCLNSKIASVRLFLHEQGRRDVTLTSRSAAFEMGTTDPHHGVRMAV